MQNYGFICNGREKPSHTNATFSSVSPINGRNWASIPECDAQDVDEAVRAADACFRNVWGKLSPSARGRHLEKFADVIEAHGADVAAVETRDNGKLLKETKGQLGVVPGWYRYYAGLADKIEGSVVPLDNIEAMGFTQYEPYGVVGVITPWNSPVLLTTLAIAPALAAGNTVVVKPSEVASASVLELGRLAQIAGLPSGAINIVTGSKEAGAALSSHDMVQQMTFTGGEQVGKMVAATAAKRCVPTVMELGGKSANIVFDDANLDQAEAGILAGIFAAGGQTCIAGSRALIHKDIFDEMVTRLTRRTEKIRIGDPLDDATDVGPLVSAQHRDSVLDKISKAQADGAKLIIGGEKVEGDGFFVKPTILKANDRHSYIMETEVFGPVLALYPFTSEEEALEIANDSPYGLAAGIWSKDITRIHRFAKQLEAGTVWANMYRSMTFNMPFGGYKRSGYGRLNGKDAIYNYLQTKSVWIDMSGQTQDPFVLKTRS